MSAPFFIHVNRMCGNRFEHWSSKRYWVLVQETEPGVYKVMRDNITYEYAGKLCFSAWDRQVVDLDGFSDEAQCFHMSRLLRWRGVHLEPDCFYAPSATMLKRALKHVTMGSWDGYI